MGLRGGCIEAPEGPSFEAQRAESGEGVGIFWGRGSQPLPTT